VYQPKNIAWSAKILLTKPKLPGHQGTQGCVYKATTRGPERKSVAIKVVLKSRLSKAGRDNLVSEIGLLKQLRHRFILELVDFHWDDRNIYIVTELCSGGDLSAVIKARRKLPESQVQRLAQQLAVALRYLREHGVSHLDLKPSNLLVSGTQPPLLKVADFGFAQHLKENATERGLRGSPLYMAPDQTRPDQTRPDQCESVKVWKWECESESVKVRVRKWECESESVKVRVWKWEYENESVKMRVWKWDYESESLKLRVWK